MPPRKPAAVHRPLSLPAVLHALSDPTRLQIVRQLAANGETACGNFPIDAPKSSMSHHFAVLLHADLIDRRKDGTTQFNRLRKSEVDAAYPGLLDAILAGVRKERL